MPTDHIPPTIHAVYFGPRTDRITDHLGRGVSLVQVAHHDDPDTAGQVVGPLASQMGVRFWIVNMRRPASVILDLVARRPPERHVVLIGPDARAEIEDLAALETLRRYQGKMNLLEVVPWSTMYSRLPSLSRQIDVGRRRAIGLTHLRLGFDEFDSADPMSPLREPLGAVLHAMAGSPHSVSAQFASPHSVSAQFASPTTVRGRLWVTASEGFPETVSFTVGWTAKEEEQEFSLKLYGSPNTVLVRSKDVDSPADFGGPLLSSRDGDAALVTSAVASARRAVSGPPDSDESQPRLRHAIGVERVLEYVRASAQESASRGLPVRRRLS